MMRDADQNDPIPPKTFAVVLVLVIGVIVVRAGLAMTDLDGIVAAMSNDDVMRMVTVRNWLGGQGWFDMVETRLVPPEGVLMHWSRFLDAAIAAVLVPLTSVFPAHTAELLTVTIWPTILMIIMVLCIGFGGRHIFGPMVACFAVVCTVLWPWTSDFYFRPGKVDHHNVQVLMMILMTLAIVWPGRAATAGAIAGLSAAFSLAIGLEGLPYILVLGLLLLLRATFDATPTASRLLVFFCCFLAAGAVAFWIGQTPPTGLLNPVCDQLGTPVLSLIAIAVCASIIPALFVARKPMFRLGFSVLLTLIGCALAWPLLGPCAAGPYASLPVTVQEIISNFIVEGQPALAFATERPIAYNTMMTPVIATVSIAAYFWFHQRRQGGAAPASNDAVGQLLLLSIVGILASFSQIRLLVMTAAAVPLLAGCALASLFTLYRENRTGGAAMGLLAAGTLILTPFLLNAPLQSVLRNEAGTPGSQDTACRDHAPMAALNQIDPTLVLAPMNLGPLLLWATHHSGLSGPYHRSAEAFTNGLLPFQMSEPELKAFIREVGATHLLLCKGTYYGEGLASGLSAGEAADWLRPIQAQSSDILAFEVLPTGGG